MHALSRLLPSIAATATVVAIALILAGCGGSDSEASAPLTKAEFIQQSDAICTESNRAQAPALHALQREAEDQSKKEQKASAEKFLKTVVFPAVQKEAEEIGELDAPKAEAAKADALVAAIEAGVKQGEKDIPAMVEGPNKQFEKANKLADAFGFEVCGA